MCRKSSNFAADFKKQDEKASYYTIIFGDSDLRLGARGQ